jgi:hypothetical protein
VFDNPKVSMINLDFSKTEISDIFETHIKMPKINYGEFSSIYKNKNKNLF